MARCIARNTELGLESSEKGYRLQFPGSSKRSRLYASTWYYDWHEVEFQHLFWISKTIWEPIAVSEMKRLLWLPLFTVLKRYPGESCVSNSVKQHLCRLHLDNVVHKLFLKRHLCVVKDPKRRCDWSSKWFMVSRLHELIVINIFAGLPMNANAVLF